MPNDLNIFDDYANKMSSTFKLYGVGDSNIEVDIQATMFNEIPVIIEIPPQNKLSAIFDLIEAPMVSDINHPVEDSFVTSDTPYNAINYGANKSLQVGRNIKGNHIGLIQFNLNHIKQDVILQGARLRLYYSYLEDMTDMTLSTGRDEWSELGVTYLNRPRVQKFITNEYIVNAEESYIEFNVTNTILGWLKGIENNGFILASESLTSVFRSRESTFSPVLFVDYKELPTHKSAYKRVLVDLSVRGLTEDSVDVEINVHSAFAQNDVDVHINVHNTNDIIENDILVELESVAKEVFNSEDEVLVEITTVIQDLDNINVLITVLEFEAQDDIPVIIAIQRNEESNIDIEIEVDKAELVEHTSIIPVSIDIIGLYTNNNSSVDVEILVPQFNNSSNVDVEISVLKQTNSSIDVLLEVPSFNDSDSVDVVLNVENYQQIISAVDVEISVADRQLSEESVDVELHTLEAPRYDGNNSIDTTLHVRGQNVSDIHVEITIPNYNDDSEVLVEIESLPPKNKYYAYVYMI